MGMRLRGNLLSRHRRTAAIAGGVLAAGAGLALYACFAPFDPPESKLTAPGTVVLGADGVVLQRDGNEGFRIPVALEDVSPVMREATIAAEDQRFGSHPGVDPLAVGRAVLRFRGEHSGASTITQQLARRLYLADGGGPLPVRKVRESLIALQLEAHRSKDEILALYLNEVYYGRGAYGIEAAARVYFGVAAADLDLARAAYLAGLPQLPGAYSDSPDEAGAKARQGYVLGRLAGDGKVTRVEADAAAAQALLLLDDIEPAIGEQFAAYAMAEMARARPDLAGRDGLVIETTLDSGLQVEAERLVRLRLEGLAGRNVTNAAVVVVEPGTGRILAMVGSASGAINMALEPRQPGSALKPILYAAAMERGFTAASPLLDVPTTFDSNGEPYAPQNFDRSFHGVVTLRTALGSSLNVPAVQVLDQVGIDGFLDLANRFGLTTLTDAERYGLAVTLGGAEVRLLDLTGAYAAFAAGGARAEPFAVSRVRDGSGRVLYEHTATDPTRVIPAQDAYILSDVLADAEARVTGFGHSTPFDLPFPAAAKTGTTTGFRDNWTLGYTRGFAVGVWVGNADGAPMREVSGVDGAGPIWRDVMMAAALTRPPEWMERPPGIVEARVCSPTGLLPGLACPFAVRELFVAGTAPTTAEQYYTRLANGQVAIDPPLAARAWARDAGLALAESEARNGDELLITSPVNGSVFFLAPELPQQRLLARAVAATGGEITFWLDGVRVGAAATADGQLALPMTAGRHELQASSELPGGGTVRATTTFEVKAR